MLEAFYTCGGPPEEVLERGSKSPRAQIDEMNVRNA